MAEIQSRPSAATRGRGSSGRGRGGLSSRGGRATAKSSHPNGESSPEDDSELALKQQYATEISQLKEIFPEWSDFDLASALQQTSGDLENTVDGIASGLIQKWGEVPKKNHSRAKPKESALVPMVAEASNTSRPARGGRAESARGRGRGAERGGRGSVSTRARGAPQAVANGSRQKDNQALSVPTTQAWGDTSASDSWANDDSPRDSAASKPAIAIPVAPKPANPPVKTWASMLRQSTQPKPTSKPIETVQKPAIDQSDTSTESAIVDIKPAEPEPADESVPAAGVESEPASTTQEQAELDNKVPAVVEPEVALPPSKDQLTETNLDQVADESHPPATATVASTAADSWDPRQNLSASATPLSASQQQAQNAARVSPTTISTSAGSGYATTAQKATERAPRAASHHQRRILDQEESVRMPGMSNREVDRAAVQFGAFSLGDAEEDIDEDREEAETRAQPPAESPINHPRASLPPPQPASIPEVFTASKPATSSASAHASATPPISIPTGPSASTAPLAVPTGPAFGQPPAGAPTQPAAAAAAASQHQASHMPPQYGRFSQPGAQEQPGFPHKAYDSFTGPSSTPSAPQSQAQSQYESSLSAATQAHQPLIQPGSGAFTSGSNDFPYYATADQTNRGPYNYYNHQYNTQQQQQHQQGQQGQQQQPGQQGLQGQTPNQQEATLVSQQRGFGAYGAGQSDNLSQYPQSAVQTSRFGTAAAAEAHHSGHNTPTPAHNQPVGGAASQLQQQQQGQAQQGQAQQGQQQPGYGGYQGHPYYNSPYYSNYMYGGNNYSGNYAGGPYGKGAGGGGGGGGAYGQPHQYGMNPQGPFDHSSSGASGFSGQGGSLHRNDSGLSSNFGADYQRGGSNLSTSQPGLGGAGSFNGAAHETYGRGGASYSSQAGQGGYNAQASQPGNGVSGVDDLKPPYGDSKATGGPSPSLSAAARPGSAANTAVSQSGLPPSGGSQQGGMAGYGGYPGHFQGQHGIHGNQTGGGNGYGIGGGAGGQQQGLGNTGFPAYNQYGGGNSYYGGGNQQQQQRGWGGNYH